MPVRAYCHFQLLLSEADPMRPITRTAITPWKMRPDRRKSRKRPVLEPYWVIKPAVDPFGFMASSRAVLTARYCGTERRKFASVARMYIARCSQALILNSSLNDKAL